MGILDRFSRRQRSSRSELPGERHVLPEDRERGLQATYSFLATEKLQELLASPSDLIPGAEHLVRAELERRRHAEREAEPQTTSSAHFGTAKIRKIRRIFILVDREPPNPQAFAHEVLVGAPTHYLDELEEGENKIFVWQAGHIDFARPGAVHASLLIHYMITFGADPSKEILHHNLRFWSFKTNFGISGCVVAEYRGGPG